MSKGIETDPPPSAVNDSEKAQAPVKISVADKKYQEAKRKVFEAHDDLLKRLAQ